MIHELAQKLGEEEIAQNDRIILHVLEAYLVAKAEPYRCLRQRCHTTMHQDGAYAFHCDGVELVRFSGVVFDRAGDHLHLRRKFSVSTNFLLDLSFKIQ